MHITTYFQSKKITVRVVGETGKIVFLLAIPEGLL
jgi:hypothetical protein